MPKLYQHELIKNLRALNEGVEDQEIERVLKGISKFIEFHEHYLPDDYLKVFDVMVKDSPSFESLFSVLLKPPSTVELPIPRIFLPAALFDMCTDHKHNFIGQTHQKVIEIIRDAELHPKSYPETDELISKIRNYDEELVDSELDINKCDTSHNLNTGNWLIKFLKEHIELKRQEQEVAAWGVGKGTGSWVDRFTPGAAVSKLTMVIPKKKSVRFAASGIVDNLSNGEKSGIHQI